MPHILPLFPHSLPIQLVTMSCLNALQIISHPTPPHPQAKALIEAFVMS